MAIYEKYESIFISISDLIILCNHLDEYPAFRESSKNFLKKYGRERFLGLNDPDKIKSPFKRYLRNYYQANEGILKDIAEANQGIISGFLHKYFGYELNLPDYDQLYEYLLQHRDDLETIKGLLKKLSNLGFTEITLAEDADFTTKKHTAYPNCSTVTYLENMVPIANCVSDEVDYTTTGSRYMMCLERATVFSPWNKIYLNTLVIDPKDIPDKIDYEEIRANINGLKERVQAQCETLRATARFKIGYDEFLVALEDFLLTVPKDSSKYQGLELAIKRLKDALKKFPIYIGKYDEEAMKTGVSKEQIEDAVQRILFLQKTDSWEPHP